MSLILVYITARNEKEAEKISLHLLNKKLVACTNIFPISSLYHWNGKLQKEKEFVVIAKTINRNYKLIIKEIEKVHSYDCPCIIKIPIRANEKYKQWLLSQLN